MNNYLMFESYLHKILIEQTKISLQLELKIIYLGDFYASLYLSDV